MTYKIIDVNVGGRRYTATFNTEEQNTSKRIKVKQKWYDTAWHEKTVASFGCARDALRFITNRF